MLIYIVIWTKINNVGLVEQKSRLIQNFKQVTK